MIAGRVVRIASFLVLSFLSSGARAQGPERWVVPLRDDVALRCGASSVDNPVTVLKKSQTLRADLEKDGYVRVAYPPGTLAVVPMSEADLNAATNTVTLTRRSRLKAYSRNDPVMEECWRALMEDFLVPGTTLKHVGAMNNRAGKAEGYVVEAPAGAYGWVLAGDVRNANADEMKRVAGGAAGVTAASPAQTPPVGLPPAGTPAPAEPAAPDATTPGETPPAAEPPAQPESKPAMPEQGNAPPPAEVRPKAPPPISPEEALTRKVKRLDQSMDVLDREPLETAELGPLIGEYEKARTEAIDIGAGPRLSGYISTKIELLRLREDHQKTTRAIRELEERARRGAGDIADRIMKLAKGREYQVVGRMMASVLYDGKRLPLLYRVMSVDTDVSRTVAYVSPAPGQSLESYLGAIVGINGEGGTDPGARVRVITPDQIDILQAAGAP